MAGLGSLAGVGDEVREAGLMRPARSVTLGVDEDPVYGHSRIVVCAIPAANIEELWTRQRTQQ